MLSRLRLHTSAAYIRKYVDSEEIRATAAVSFLVPLPTNSTEFQFCSYKRQFILHVANVVNPSSSPVAQGITIDLAAVMLTACNANLAFQNVPSG